MLRAPSPKDHDTPPGDEPSSSSNRKFSVSLSTTDEELITIRPVRRFGTDDGVAWLVVVGPDGLAGAGDVGAVGLLGIVPVGAVVGKLVGD
jgi:hypothetical protein